MNVAILGLGVVGKGVYDLINKNHKDINIKYILEKDENKTKNIDSTVTTDYNTIIEDPKIDTVIELMGGLTFAYTAIKKALEAGKNVVTANKAVISKHFEELISIADTNNVSLLYEASVGGGMIVLNPLLTISNNNEISSIKGIMSGSTNYVLSKLFLEDKSLELSLEEAFENGYLETGNTDDMDGLDVLRKINILSSISYHQYFNESDIHVNPLSSLTSNFLNYIKSKGFIVKYFGTSYKVSNEVVIKVEPVILSSSNPYSNINYEVNRIELKGTNFEHMAFEGIGAGRYPTAQAVVYDLTNLKRNKAENFSFNRTDLSVNNDLDKNKYLIEQDKSFIVTEEVTLSELHTKYKNIKCYARIEGNINV
jgi:homoserine dehydrogenase